jgi:hypothetical protein
MRVSQCGSAMFYVNVMCDPSSQAADDDSCDPLIASTESECGGIAFSSLEAADSGCEVLFQMY